MKFDITYSLPFLRAIYTVTMFAASKEDALIKFKEKHPRATIEKIDRCP